MGGELSLKAGDCELARVGSDIPGRQRSAVQSQQQRSREHASRSGPIDPKNYPHLRPSFFWP